MTRNTAEGTVGAVLGRFRLDIGKRLKYLPPEGGRHLMGMVMAPRMAKGLLGCPVQEQQLVLVSPFQLRIFCELVLKRKESYQGPCDFILTSLLPGSNEMAQIYHLTPSQQVGQRNCTAKDNRSGTISNFSLDFFFVGGMEGSLFLCLFLSFWLGFCGYS